MAEYQARGVIHFHAVIRLDAPGEDYQPPPEWFTADLLADAIVQAAAAVRRAVGPDDDHPDSQALTLRFGGQVDPRPVRPASEGLPGTGRKLSADAVSNYIAKYATKTLEGPGLPSRPLRSRFDIDSLRCSRHYKQMIATAWDLGARHATGNARLRKARTRSAEQGTSSPSPGATQRPLASCAEPAPSTASVSSSLMASGTLGAPAGRHGGPGPQGLDL